MTDKEFQHNLNLIQDKDKAGLRNIEQIRELGKTKKGAETRWRT